MKINISDLIYERCDEISVDTKVDIESIRRGGEIIQLTEPVSVKGNLYRVEQSILFSGSLNTTIQTECCRCLDEVVSDISISFDEIVKVENEEEAQDIIADVEKECISLEGFVERLLILKLPMRFLCDIDCKGLCSQCGTNLNNSQCSCDREDIDIRLVKLKELLKQD